jgi:hypothetical protein
MKKIFLLSVFLLTIVFSYSVTLQDLLLLKKSNDISMSEIIQCLLDDVNKSAHHKFQKAETNSSSYIVNSSSPTVIFSYQSETAGPIQPKKAILRI